jgi:hypothetical protein
VAVAVAVAMAVAIKLIDNNMIYLILSNEETKK